MILNVANISGTHKAQPGGLWGHSMPVLGRWHCEWVLSTWRATGHYVTKA